LENENAQVGASANPSLDTKAYETLRDTTPLKSIKCNLIPRSKGTFLLPWECGRGVRLH